MSTRGKRSERGASAVEYGLFVAGVVLAILVPAQGLGLGVGVILDKCAEPSIEKGYLNESAGESCG